MSIAQHIHRAQDIVLTTHRQCDGDGLGCELALYHALKKIGKNVSIINMDSTPKKYRYLNPDSYIQYLDQNPTLPESMDLCLIFDTNDERLVEPLFSRLKVLDVPLLFIDHHPLLTHGPRPDIQSFINMEAASTGEVVFDLIQLLNIPLDQEIARALYTSITFDTQLYRFIRNSPKSHTIAAELLNFPIEPEMIHRHLFSHQTVNKISFMAKLFSNIEYYAEGRLACAVMSKEDMDHFQLDYDEVRDVTDQIMSIDSIEIALVIRQDAPNKMKVSLRSKGTTEVLSVAESIGGGGHWYASGGGYTGHIQDLKRNIITQLETSIRDSFPLDKVHRF
jgi:bifunctional oligoribonuclease and PAP phosphatase NrnA